MNSNAQKDSSELDRHQYKLLLVLNGGKAILLSLNIDVIHSTLAFFPFQTAANNLINYRFIE